jgi:hypothetical protein
MLEFIKEALGKYAEVHNLHLDDAGLWIEVDRAALYENGVGVARFLVTSREMSFDI